MDALTDSTTPGSPPADRWLTELVVPLDGSRFAERALDVAVDLARHVGVGVVRLSCAEAVGAAVSTNPPAGVGLRIWRALDDPEPPLDVLIRLQGELPGHVVCQASHGRSGPGRRPLGRIADAVIRDDRVPVVVVGGSCQRRWLDGGGPVIGCVGPDDVAAGTRRMDAVVESTHRWAGTLGRDWRLVTVVDPDRVAAFDPPPGVELIPSRHPAAAVRSLADRSRAALLVMGAHRARGRCSASEMLRPVIAGATCPVFVPAG